MKNEVLKPGWKWVKFGDVVRLSKTRSKTRWPMVWSVTWAWNTWSRVIYAFAVGVMWPTA